MLYYNVPHLHLYCKESTKKGKFTHRKFVTEISSIHVNKVVSDVWNSHENFCNKSTTCDFTPRVKAQKRSAACG